MGTILASEGKADDYQERYSRAYAERLDEQDPLKHLRSEFTIPTRYGLKSRASAQTCKPQVICDLWNHVISIFGSAGFLLFHYFLFPRFFSTKWRIRS